MMKKLMLAVALACGVANVSAAAVVAAVEAELPVLADQEKQAVTGFKAWVKNNPKTVAAVVVASVVGVYGFCAYKSEAYANYAGGSDDLNRAIAWDIFVAPALAAAYYATNNCVVSGAKGAWDATAGTYPKTSLAVTLAAAAVVADLFRTNSLIKGLCSSKAAVQTEDAAA